MTKIEQRLERGLQGRYTLDRELGQADDLLFFVMPNVEGRSLRERLDADGQLPLDEALRITRAFACLDRAVQDRSAGLIFFHVDPGFAPLRGDPRFAEIVRQLGLK